MKQTIQIKTNDDSKFQLGKNIASTPGKVVYQNEVMQLIHYKPIKDSYYNIPILIVSPFINKYNTNRKNSEIRINFGN